jgi:hypothetical protein
MNGWDKYLTVEDWDHIKVVNHLKLKYPDVIFTHVPSAGRKSAFERYKYSLLGVKRGIADIIIFHPKYSEIKTDAGGKQYRDLIYVGLLIELKAGEHKRVVLKGKDAGKVVKTKGKLAPEQADLIVKLAKLKYRAVCHYGADSAIEEIEKYFKP